MRLVQIGDYTLMETGYIKIGRSVVAEDFIKEIAFDPDTTYLYVTDGKINYKMLRPEDDGYEDMKALYEYRMERIATYDRD